MAITKGASESVRSCYPDHTLAETETTIPPPPTHTHTQTGLSDYVIYTVVPLYHTSGDMDSTAVTTVYVCEHYSEDTCKTMSLHVRMLNASVMKRQEKETGLHGCTCMCGNSRGSPTSSGDKQAIRVTHRVHAEL